MLTSYIKALVMNLIFADIYSKSKYIHIFALVAKLGTNIANVLFPMN